MLKVDSIEKGIVLDHIQAGKAMQVYQYLNLDRLDCSVAIIKNVKSKIQRIVLITERFFLFLRPPFLGARVSPSCVITGRFLRPF